MGCAVPEGELKTGAPGGVLSRLLAKARGTLSLRGRFPEEPPSPRQRNRPPPLGGISLGGTGPGPAGDGEAPVLRGVTHLAPLDLAVLVHKNERRRPADDVADVALAKLVARDELREGAGPRIEELPDGLLVLVAHREDRHSCALAPRHQ